MSAARAAPTLAGMRRLLILSLVACTASPPATRSPQPTPVVAPVPIVAPAGAPAAPPPAAAAPAPVQQFADADPGYAFADPDRRTKLLAAVPKIDAAIADERKQQAVPGLAVGVVIDGELVYARGHGVADVDSKAAPDADTAYRIGSISKSFAALGLLALRDDGVVQLDEPVTRWVPEAAGLVYPTHDARPVTLRQLVTHTSGLARDVDFRKTASEAEFLAQLRGLPLDNPPGQQFVYSNLGFALVGITFARASHLPLADAMARRVFGPLGMTSSAYDTAPRLAPAYDPDNHTRRTELEQLRVAGGAGGVVSTVRDMARYIAFQLSAYPPRSGDDSGPVRRATIREAHATGFANGASVRPRPAARRGEPAVALEATAYGFGWQHHETCDGDDLVEHGGAIDSYRASVQLLTRHGVGVVVLSNFGNANTYRVAERVIAELRATGALQPYVAHPRLAPGFEAVMTAFLAVYNHWDQAALAALLTRPVDPSEPAEIDGYHKLHGACSGFTVREAPSSTTATFAMTCERGQFELRANFSQGKLSGFIGTSHGVPVPREVTTAVRTALGLLVHWDEAAFARGYANAAAAHDQIKQQSSFLGKDAGACKPGEIAHEGLGWSFDATCERARVHFSLELDGAKIKQFNARKLDAGSCPTR